MILPKKSKLIKNIIRDKDNNNIYLNNFSYLKEENIFKSVGSIKVIDKDQSIAFDLIGDPIVHKDEFLGETVIFRNNLALKISDQTERNLKDYEVIFQGCAEKRFCYTPIKVKLSSL